MQKVTANPLVAQKMASITQLMVDRGYVDPKRPNVMPSLTKLAGDLELIGLIRDFQAQLAGLGVSASDMAGMMSSVMTGGVTQSASDDNTAQKPVSPKVTLTEKVKNLFK